MQTPEDIDRLENLLRHNDFADLTTAEKTWVLQNLRSEEVYTALRLTEQRLAQSFSRTVALHPRPGIRTDLHKSLAKSRQKTSLLTRVWSHPIPAYQVAAGLLLLLGAFFWYVSQPTEPIQVTGFTPLRDTIFITRHDTVIREKKVAITRYKTLPATDPVTAFRLNYDTTGIAVPAQIKNPPAQGVSMKEDTLLQHFFVRENER
jgi:hypothetical protein